MNSLSKNLLLGLCLFTALSSISVAQEVRSAKSKSIAVDYINVENSPSEIVIVKPIFLKESMDPISIDSDEVEVAGIVKDENGVKELTMNGQQIDFAEDGYFSFSYKLNHGINTMILEVVDIAGGTTTKEYLMNSDRKELTFSLKITGKYYALIMGINDYKDPRINDLDGAVKDAEELAEALVKYYTFEPENVTLLTNPTYVQIISALDGLSNSVGPEDNLMVFYAGHGWWDEKKELGYWLPGDAQKENTAYWIPNSRISDYIGSIQTKHTLLVADACFSGSIFKTRAAFVDAQPAINKLYQLPSRKAMTSGTLVLVPDRSVFVEYMVKRLTSNTDKYLSSQDLFTRFRKAAVNNSPIEGLVPQWGEIQRAGDEGGDFIFVRR